MEKENTIQVRKRTKKQIYAELPPPMETRLMKRLKLLTPCECSVMCTNIQGMRLNPAHESEARNRFELEERAKFAEFLKSNVEHDSTWKVINWLLNKYKPVEEYEDKIFQTELPFQLNRVDEVLIKEDPKENDS